MDFERPLDLPQERKGTLKGNLRRYVFKQAHSEFGREAPASVVQSLVRSVQKFLKKNRHALTRF